MPTKCRLIFVNLPVANLERSKAFFGELGFGFDPVFTDDSCACMVVSAQAYVMLIAQSRFADFTNRPIGDAHTATESIVCVSAESRDEVDEIAGIALRVGGSPANDPMDHGFMYARSFNDPDGHLWEVMWMDPRAVEQGPKAYAENA